MNRAEDPIYDIRKLRMKKDFIKRVETVATLTPFAHVNVILIDL